MDRHIGRTIVRNSAGDARVIWSIFSGYHPQGLRESGEESGIFDIFEGRFLVLREVWLVCFWFLVWILCSFFSVLTHAREPKPTRFEGFSVGMHGVSNKEGS